MTAVAAPAVTPGSPTAIARAADVLARAGAMGLAGALSGLVALGVGSRLAMRLLALSSGQIGSGVRPESGAVPGELTVEGTMFLLVAGTFIGMALAVFVGVLLDRWLPREGARRALLITLLCGAVPAMVLLDPANRDFGRFGPTWFAVALFVLCAAGYGMLVTVLSPRFTARARSGKRIIWIMLGMAGLAAMLAMSAGLGTALIAGPVVLVVVVMLVAPTGGRLRWWFGDGAQRIGQWVVNATAALALLVIGIRAGQILIF